MLDLDRLKSEANLLDLISHDTPLKKAATTGGGEWAGPCPFCGGHDRLRVQPDRGRWWCRQCSPDEHWGSVIDYVMQRDRVDFQEAVARLNGKGLAVDFQPKQSTTPEPEAQDGDWPAAAAAVVDQCEGVLWADGPGSRGAREWLHKRGLADDTLKAWHIGFNGASRKIGDLWVESGVTVPYFAGGKLYAVNVRRPDAILRSKPATDKYKMIRGSKRVLFGAEHLSGKPDVMITEGEFDAMLIWQAARERVDVLTMGAAKTVPAGAWLLYLVTGQRFYIATDRDPAGDEAAARWLEVVGKRGLRVTVPSGKDITEYWQSGGAIGEWVTHLGVLTLLDEPGAHTDATWPSRYADAAIAAGLACIDGQGNDQGAQGWQQWAAAR